MRERKAVKLITNVVIIGNKLLKSSGNRGNENLISGKWNKDNLLLIKETKDSLLVSSSATNSGISETVSFFLRENESRVDQSFPLTKPKLSSVISRFSFCKFSFCSFKISD